MKSFIGVMAVGLAVVAAPQQARAVQDQPGFIEVTGSGTVTIAPDRASVSFSVETQRPTAREAAEENATRMEAVMDRLRRAVPDAEIRSSGYRVDPRYERENDPNGSWRNVLVGYTAFNRISVTLTGTDGVGRVIDMAIDSGANRVDGVRFFAEDTRGAELDALAMAVEDAGQQAAVIAHSLGASLGAPVEVYKGARPRGGETLQVAATSFEAARAVDTPIEAGDITLRETVTIRYRIGG